MRPCPYCGDTKSGYSVRGQLIGASESYFSADGKLEETNLDNLYWTSRRKLVRCGKCYKVRNDLTMNNMREIVEKTLY